MVYNLWQHFVKIYQNLGSTGVAEILIVLLKACMAYHIVLLKDIIALQASGPRQCKENILQTIMQ